jgi:hypothetical protein
MKELTVQTWKMIQEIAPVMQASRLFGVASPEAAMAIMLKGHECGLSLTAAFEFIQVINGRPTLSPRGALALIQQSQAFADMKITDEPGKCTVWMKRSNGFEYEICYTIEEAKAAGIVKPDSAWTGYQANMLRWRAVGFCADVVFPDIIGGMKRSDEFGALITEEGDVWEEEPVETIPDYGYTLQQLLTTVDEADILKANFGILPLTVDEVNVVVHRLVEEGKLDVIAG